MPKLKKTARVLRSDLACQRLALILNEPRNELRLQHIYAAHAMPETRLPALVKLAVERGFSQERLSAYLR